MRVLLKILVLLFVWALIMAPGGVVLFFLVGPNTGAPDSIAQALVFIWSCFATVVGLMAQQRLVR